MANFNANWYVHLVVGFGDTVFFFGGGGKKKDSNKSSSKNARHVLCTSYFLYMYSTYASYGFSDSETNVGELARLVFSVVDVPKKFWNIQSLLLSIMMKRSLPWTAFLRRLMQKPVIKLKLIYSSEISPTRCNNCVFILRNGFTLHVSGDSLIHHQEYICCIWPQVSRLT